MYGPGIGGEELSAFLNYVMGLISKKNWDELETLVVEGDISVKDVLKMTCNYWSTWG